MKKPVNEIERVRGFYSRGDFWDDSVRVVLDFLGALPAEFEIVEPGNVQVKWPTCAYRGAMEFSADTCDMTGHKGTAILLRALAAIAPEEKKKRRVKVLVTLDFGTHKVGPIESECEVDT